MIPEVYSYAPDARVIEGTRRLKSAASTPSNTTHLLALRTAVPAAQTRASLRFSAQLRFHRGVNRCAARAIDAIDATLALLLIQLRKNAVTRVTIRARIFVLLVYTRADVRKRGFTRTRVCDVLRSVRPASRADEEILRKDVLRASRRRVASCIPNAPAAVETSGWIRCGRRTADRKMCRDRIPD